MHSTSGRNRRRAPSAARCRAAAALLAGFTIVAASAQNAKVYVANSSNSRILSVQFDPPATTLVNADANRLTQVRDIAIRDDGLDGLNLIAADRNGGQVVFYANAAGAGQVICDCTAAGPERPDGLSLDLAGNLFVMNSGQGSSGGVSQVWAIWRDPSCGQPGGADCRPGGYRGAPGLIDHDVQVATTIGGSPALLRAESLPESLVVTSNTGVLTAGDVLVLTHPASLLRYSGAEVAAFLDQLADGFTPAQLTPQTVIHPGNASVPAAQRFPADVEPNGMAFAANGDLLIAVSDGRILIYGSDGLRRSNGTGGFLDFTAGTGQDELKIAVGLQDGRQRAFVTHQQRGELRRYTINADGTGTLDTLLVDFQFPVGVDATNSNTVPAPAGSNVDITPTSILSSRIEQVVLAGQVNARVSTFADPREQEQSVPADQPLHRPLYLNELRADLPPIMIPAYARAFRLDDPQTGTPTFILVEADSSAAVSGLIDHHAIESEILGYDPDCLDPVATQRPYLFWSPDENDPPIVEGAVFIDVTTGCGTIRGITRDMSYFLAGVRITAPMRSVVSGKLDGLAQLIAGSNCIERRTKRRLEGLMDRALRDFGRNNYAGVAGALREIDDTVERSPAAFAGCVGNVSGDIQARCRTALYSISKLP